jgi:cephalosporin-C deacetylase
MPIDELEGYTPAIAEPADFDDFWRGTLDLARTADRGITRERVPSPLRDVDVFDLTFSGFAGDPVRAWLLLPTRRDGPLPAVVEYTGYTSGRGLAEERLNWSAAGYAHLVMDTRGQGSGWGGGGSTLDPHGSGPCAPGFMTRGIDDHETYYYRRVFTDAAMAVDAMRGLPEVDADAIAVTGGSQGGGIAIAAAGLSTGLIAVMPDVPFLCHYERAVGLTGADPYQEIVRYLAAHRHSEERVFRTLSYFDGANFALRATAPALYSTALLDQVCPPSTVFAAFNRHAHPDRRIISYANNEHEGGQTQQWLEQARFLAARLAGTPGEQ